MTESHIETIESFRSYCNLKTKDEEIRNRMITLLSKRNEDKNQEKSKSENQLKENKNELDESIDFLNKQKREIELLETYI